MPDLQTEFEAAAQRALQLPTKPDNDTLLKLYALYKQATMGYVSGRRPGFRDLKGRIKYDAWARLRGRSKERAMQDYIDLVEQL